MSLYQAPTQHNGSINAIFNSADFVQPTSTTQAGNDARYLRNSGVVVSNGTTTFNSSVSVGGTLNVGLLNARESTDTMVQATFSANQTYSILNGMVYRLSSTSVAINSISFTDIPTTPLQTYIFTFIITPPAPNNAYYINPNSQMISVNSLPATVYGLQTVILPSGYTYLVQQITIINNSSTPNLPNFQAFTSVSGY